MTGTETPKADEFVSQAADAAGKPRWVQERDEERQRKTEQQTKYEADQKAIGDRMDARNAENGTFKERLGIGEVASRAAKLKAEHDTNQKLTAERIGENNALIGTFQERFAHSKAESEALLQPTDKGVRVIDRSKLDKASVSLAFDPSMKRKPPEAPERIVDRRFSKPELTSTLSFGERISAGRPKDDNDRPRIIDLTSTDKDGNPKIPGTRFKPTVDRDASISSKHNPSMGEIKAGKAEAEAREQDDKDSDDLIRTSTNYEP